MSRIIQSVLLESHHSVQNNDQVRRARDNAHVLIKGFSESLPRYALIQLRFERSKEYFYKLSMRFNAL